MQIYANLNPWQPQIKTHSDFEKCKKQSQLLEDHNTYNQVCRKPKTETKE